MYDHQDGVWGDGSSSYGYLCYPLDRGKYFTTFEFLKVCPILLIYSLCYKWFAILHLGRFQFLAHQNRNVIVEQVVELVFACIGVSLANV